MSPSLHNTKIVKHAMQAKKSKQNQGDGKASTDSQEMAKRIKTSQQQQD